MKRITISVVASLLLLTIFRSCKKEDCGNCIDEKLKPRAYVGKDQTILLQMDCVLDGKSSYDRNGAISSYAWSVLSGPPGATIDNKDLVQTFARFSQTGVYQIELKVTNNAGISATDTLQVRVETLDGSLICNRPIISAKLVPIDRLPEPRSNIKAAAAGNKLLFAGGSTSTTSGTVTIYDISTKSWSGFALSDESLRYDFAMTSVGTKVFFAGGWDNWNGFHTAVVDIYDAASESWSTANLSEARMGIAVAASDKMVVFAGGGVYDEMSNTGFRMSDALDIYNIKTNTWTKTKLNEGRMFMTASTSGNDFHFSGGTTSLMGVSDRVDVYNSSTNSWSESTLKIPRARMVGIVDQNSLFLAGGYNYDGSNTGDKYVEIIDLTTRTSNLECMIAKNGHSAIKSGDNLIFFTGFVERDDLRNGSVFEIYNTRSKIWSVGVLNRPIHNAGIVSLNNTIYVAGGIDATGQISDMLWKLEF